MSTTLEAPPATTEFHTCEIPVNGKLHHADPDLPSMSHTVSIPLSWVQKSPLNPRQRFNEAAIQQMADSIRDVGMITPIMVRDDLGGILGDASPETILGIQEAIADGTWPFETIPALPIVAGERRWRAASLIGTERISVIVRRDLDDLKHIKISVTENEVREPLTPIELARTYRLLMERNLNQTAIGKEYGRGVGSVSNTVRLLELPQDVQDLIDTGALTAGHGAAMLRFRSLPDLCSRIAATALSEQWPVNGLAARAEALMTEMERKALRLIVPEEATLPLELGDSQPTGFAGPHPPEVAPAPETPAPAVEAAVQPTLLPKPEPLNPRGDMTDAEWEASAQPLQAAEPVVTTAEPVISTADMVISNSEDDAADYHPGLYHERAVDQQEDEDRPDQAGAATQAEAQPGDDEPAKPFSRPDPAPSDSASSTPAPTAKTDTPPQQAAPGAPAPVQVVDKRHSANPAPVAKAAQETPKPAPAAAAPSLPEGWSSAMVRTADYEKARELGLWPPAAAIAEVVGLEARVKGLEEAAPYPLHPLALAAGEMIEQINREAQVLNESETAVLHALYPERETTTRAMLASVLLVRRCRDLRARGLGDGIEMPAALTEAIAQDAATTDTEGAI